MARVRKIALNRGNDWQDCLEYFLLFKKSQGLSEQTLEDYRSHLERSFKASEATLSDYDNLRLESCVSSPKVTPIRRDTGFPGIGLSALVQ